VKGKTEFLPFAISPFPNSCLVGDIYRQHLTPSKFTSCPLLSPPLPLWERGLGGRGDDKREMHLIPNIDWLSWGGKIFDLFSSFINFA
jgi:hypothetical protein